jgi:hypothetical protein
MGASAELILMMDEAHHFTFKSAEVEDHHFVITFDFG